MAALKEESSSKSFGGYQKVFSHDSSELKCKMNFSVYLPPAVQDGGKAPIMYWLSGLTCTEQNFIVKSGFQRYASEQGMIVVGPDTSPRGCGIEGEDDDWDFGTGAGFYVDATQDKWKTNYRMYSYIIKELIPLVEDNFPVIKGQRSISGHSMGGHGALIISLKNPGLFKVTTAFAPIANPTGCQWGQKCLGNYLGPNSDDWKEWDATCLVEKYNGPDLHLLVDQVKKDLTFIFEYSKFYIKIVLSGII